MQPHIDALDVKAVAAFGQAPANFIVLKWGQTNDTLELLVLRFVHKERNGGDGGGVKTLGSSGGEVVGGWVEREGVEMLEAGGAEDAAGDGHGAAAAVVGLS